MSLFLTNDDLRGCIPANVSFDIENIEPFFLEIETTVLARHISEDMYDALIVTITEIPENLKKVVELARRAVAPLALANYLPFGEVQISDVGITTVSKASDRTAAYAYQVDKLEQSCLKMGFNALEVLLAYLDSNINQTHFSHYKNSAEYKENTRLFLSSATDFSSCYNIFDSRLTYYALRTIIASIQDEKIAPKMGILFLKILKNESTGADALSEIEKKLRDRARKYLAFQSIVEAMKLQMSVELNAGGLRVNYGSMFSNAYKYYTPPSEAQKSIALDTATRRAESLWGEIASIIDEINGVVAQETTTKIIADKATVIF